MTSYETVHLSGEPCSTTSLHCLWSPDFCETSLPDACDSDITGEPLGFLLSAHLAMHGMAKAKAAMTCNDHERFQTAAGENQDHHVCHPKGETNLKLSKSKEFD